jgi:ABC-2 type transport system ATP-binding protein
LSARLGPFGGGTIRAARASPMTDAPPLQLDAVTKRFGRFTAVDDVTLTVEPGEIFALLGPNGAGKTTLISCICGPARANQGTIRVFGHDVVRDFRTTRRLVGLVPQEVNFDPFFTPHEALMNQMGLMGCPPDSAWADRLLEVFALADRRDAYTRSLSGGMKRRLLVAKALVHRPKLLFLDEPTAGVDVELRKDLWVEVRRLRDQGTTIILTTHYLEEAEELADRIGVLRRGQLVVVEDRDQMMSRHRDNGVALTFARGLPEAMPEGLLRAGERQARGRWTSPAELEALLARARAVGDVVDVQVEHTRLEDIFIDIVAEPSAS